MACGAALLSITQGANGDSALPQPATAGAPWIELVRVDGSINPAVVNLIEDALASAHATGAHALVIELDTPGGLMSSAEQIVKDLLGSEVPVIVYVSPSGAAAASAGTFITEAAN